MDNTLDKTGHGMEHKRADKAVEFRFAKPQDIPLILRFIRELADYEGMLDQVVATEELLNQWLFEKEKAEVILGMKDGETVGFALFFHNFSTFLGSRVVGSVWCRLMDDYGHIDDETPSLAAALYPEYRGQGFGTAFLNRLAAIAVERGCGRLEWWCLDWNTPSIGFYKSLGAETMEDWTVYRLTGPALQRLAEPESPVAETDEI